MYVTYLLLIRIMQLCKHFCLSKKKNVLGFLFFFFLGCLPLLIQLLHGSDKDSSLLGNTRGSKAARARASAALHNIVHSHPDDKRGRREARVLRLLEQIRAHCDQLRDSSSDEDDEEKKSRSGMFPPFCDLQTNLYLSHKQNSFNYQ